MPVWGKAQTLVNKEWEQLNGIPDSIAFSASALDGLGNLIVTSNAITAGQQANLLVMKYDRDGNLLWQDVYNGGFNGKDYGISVTTDPYNNVYVAGASQTGAITSDCVVRKYNAAGTLQWHATYSGNGLYNAPTAVAVDNGGNVYITGVTTSLTTQTDYATLKLNASGVQQWVQIYDYVGLYDVPAGIEVNATTGKVYVTGASASATNNYDYATIEYDATSGNVLNVNRVAAIGAGFDKATAIERDNAGNLYITGQAFDSNTNSYDIKTLKLNASLAVQWIQTYDHTGLEDLATTIDVDNAGNVFVGGYVGTPSEGRNFMTIKYDAAGNLLWKQEYNHALANGDDEVRKLGVNNNGDVVVTGKRENGTNTDFITLSYDPDGNLQWLKEFGSNLGNDSPSDLQTDNQGNVYVTGTSFDGTGDKNVAVRYRAFESPSTIVVDSLGNPLYLAGQIIVKFNPSIVNTSFVNDREMQFETLNSVIPDSIIEQMEAKTGVSFRASKVSKIFTRMTTADSISISRLGDSVKMEAFWSTFLVYISPSLDVSILVDSLNNLLPLIYHCEYNALGTSHSIPNDTYVNEQEGLYYSPTFPSAHINLDGAWDIETGKDYIKVGIFDSGIWWAHEDFGDGTFNGSIVKGGFDYTTGGSLPISSITSPPTESHGMACAGIIGAIRNNGKGIAGIAGGDYANNVKGVEIYSMIIAKNRHISTADAANAIVEGATNTPQFGFGLHIQNHSWGIPSPNVVSALLPSAVRTCFLNGCVFACSRGNDGTGNPLVYPACYQDDWVIAIGGSGIDGGYKQAALLSGIDYNWDSSYGNGMDITAPSSVELVRTTIYPTLPFSSLSNVCTPLNPVNNLYGCFNGTSAAAPHVTGVAALMYSLHNTQNGYSNNLAPEDVEFLLQKYATDIAPPLYPNYPIGYDVKNGWGRVDAGLTLEKINKPLYEIRHFDVPQSTSMQNVFTNQGIQLEEAIGLITPGTYYNTDLVEVIHNYTLNLGNNEQVLDLWLRKSATIGWLSKGTAPFGGLEIFDATPNEEIISQSISGNTLNVSVKTQAVFIGGTYNTWIPAPPNQLKTALSLHVYKSQITDIFELPNAPNFVLHPNPTSESVTIVCSSPSLAPTQIQITDVQGCKVQNYIVEEGHNGEYTLNISELANGVYFVSIISDIGAFTQKMIKSFVR